MIVLCKKEDKNMNKKVKKIVVWLMLILMLGSVAAGIIVYFL